MSDEIAIKYKWERDPGGVWEIYHAYDGDRQMGRVEQGVVGKHFLWYMPFNQGIKDMTGVRLFNGSADTAREAAAACEACYDAVLGLTWPGMTQKHLDELLELERWIIERREQWRREDEARAAAKG